MGQTVANTGWQKAIIMDSIICHLHSYDQHIMLELVRFIQCVQKEMSKREWCFINQNSVVRGCKSTIKFTEIEILDGHIGFII